MIADEKYTPNELWRFFKVNLEQSRFAAGPQLTSLNLILRKLFHRMLRENRRTHGGPPIHEVAEAYASMRMLRAKDFETMLKLLLSELSTFQTQAIPGDTTIPTKELDATVATRAYDDLVTDLLATWNIFLISEGRVTYIPSSEHYDYVNNWSWLRQKEGNRVLGASSTKRGTGPERTFQNLFQRFQGAQLRSVTAFAFATFALLVKSSSSTANLNMDRPFPMFLARSLVNARPDVQQVKDLVENKVPLPNVTIDWPSALEAAGSLAASSVKYAEDDPVLELANSGNSILDRAQKSRRVQVASRHAAQSGPSSIHRQLSRALADRDLTKVDKLWSDISSAAPPTPDIYNHFIMVYTGFREVSRAIGVWNHMVESSLQPTLATWNSMLEGCKAARSPKALEDVWSKMLSARMRPDMVCWTTRISGLIECNKPDLAIKALEEMGRIWLQATTAAKIKDIQSVGDTGGAVKPSIETINAAIAGLLRRGLQDAANSLLVWGAGLGIKPDIITFNTLLRPLVRDGRTAEVQRLLQIMQQQGIQADVGTFTIFLDGVFEAGQTLSPAQQSEAVKSVFDEMEAAGVQANHQTYAKIIYSLLQSSKEDLTAVQAVLSKMASQGLKPSAHINTMLVDHYFKQSQPDLAAIRTLIERVRLSTGAADHIFWDRVIEGYASLKDTANALTILGRKDRKGQRVGWYALEMVVRALADTDEWDLAAQVVHNVRIDRGGPPPPQARGVDGQHSFWRAVEELGISYG